MFATALAAGILLDATVVRALLLPAVISLLGERAWWRPAGASRSASGIVAEQSGAAGTCRCSKVGENTAGVAQW